MANKEINSWALNIKNLLFQTGFGYAWDNPQFENYDAFFDAWKQRLLDIDRQQWYTSINTMTSLRCYTQFKFDSFVEPYTIQTYLPRKFIANLRCASIDIECNQGRKHNIPYDQRICTVCNTLQIGDEYHFVLICPLLTELRIKYLPAYYYNYPTQIKLNTLLSSTSKHTITSLALYIMNAIELRKLFLDNEP